jgi:hypothetical protein
MLLRTPEFRQFSISCATLFLLRVWEKVIAVMLGGQPAIRTALIQESW